MFNEDNTLSNIIQQSKLLKLDQQNFLKKMIIAFDLDHTLIDSSHRSHYKEDGSYDLEKWKAQSTWKYIQHDTLLPLYHLYSAFKQAGFTIIAVTAREMSEDDYKYLELNDLHFDFILERGNSVQLDEDLKDGKLKEFLSKEGRIPFLFFDDKEENLEVAKKYGFSVENAHLLNIKLVVKDYESIKSLSDPNRKVTCFNPKVGDLGKIYINYFSDTIKS